jgi:hypothetical protein
LIIKLDQAVEMVGMPVLSIFIGRPSQPGFPDLSLVQLCMAVHLPHGQVQSSTVGALTGAGFSVTPDASDDQGPYHYHCQFQWGYTQADTARFISTFEGPIMNPAKGGTN